MLKPATNAAIAVGIAMGLYQMVSSQYIFVEPLELQNIHLAFALALLFECTQNEQEALVFFPVTGDDITIITI